jgi:putative membrane protein
MCTLFIGIRRPQMEKMRTINVTILALMLVAGVGLSACSDRAPQRDIEGYAMTDESKIFTDLEKEFVEYASEMHVGEIALAQQAKQKSSNEGVTKYADAVIKTHTDALENLSDRAEGSAELSKKASRDTESHAEFLSTLSGAQFEKEFMDLMVADHQSAIETFRAQSLAGQNANLKKYIAAAIPDLEGRLEEARKLQTK